MKANVFIVLVGTLVLFGCGYVGVTGPTETQPTGTDVVNETPANVAEKIDRSAPILKFESNSNEDVFIQGRIYRDAATESYQADMVIDGAKYKRLPLSPRWAYLRCHLTFQEFPHDRYESPTLTLESEGLFGGSSKSNFEGKLVLFNRTTMTWFSVGVTAVRW